MGETLVITSGKGGVGKTTVAANLGITLGGRGQRVALVDTDTGLRNLDLMLGLENRILYDLLDVAQGACTVEQALVRERRMPALSLLPAAQTHDKDCVAPERMRAILTELRATHDTVLIDCPAGIDQGFISAVACADRALLVVVQEVSSVRDALKVRTLLDQMGIAVAGAVINRWRPRLERRGQAVPAQEISALLRCPILGRVREQPRATGCTNSGDAIITRSRAARADFAAIAAALGSGAPPAAENTTA